jgi:predicted TIM-barrel fold metal-dependent hydrolase
MDVSKVERIFDSDTHAIENPNVWTSRLPKSWGDDVMHLVYDDESGRENWCIGDERVAPGWMNCFYGSEGENIQARRSPATQAQVSPVCYDAKERIRVMDEWKVQTSVLFPNASGFSLEPFVAHPNPEISAAHISAYNDYMIEEWVDPFPGRFVPMAEVSYWDVPRAVKEIERIAGKGFGGIITTGVPQLHGQPFMRDPHWDPMWRAAEEAGLPFAFHVANANPGAAHGQPEIVTIESDDITQTRIGTLICLDNAAQMTDLLLSGVLGRFPDLHFVISESGMGWVPFILEACDARFHRQKIRLPEFGGLLPSELFARQIHINFFFEAIDPWHISRLGSDNLMFQTDIPHPTGFYYDDEVDIETSIQTAVGQLDEETATKILWGNAATLYGPALASQGAPVG